ncbi:MAG TPA: segregation/condensation protein A [Thermoanaerobaculia bacterium]|nr:segregation/condensation protein A [Thermoanaerobaculia bacterium]
MNDETLEKSLPPIAIEAFSGPFDLLLHLIRVNEVSITDIPIAEITEQYSAYLDAMQELDLDIASDYVALAAELIYIKSRMLLPREPGAAEEDPRRDLALRLQEYERFKQAAEDFHGIDTLRAGLWSRPATEVPRSSEGETLEVSLFDLIQAFRQATERYRLAHPPSLEIRHIRFSVRSKMEELLARLEASGRETLSLLAFLGEMHYRAEAVTAFLAALELIRLGVVRVFQPTPFGEIHATRTDLAFSADQVRETYRD